MEGSDRDSPSLPPPTEPPPPLPPAWANRHDGDVVEDVVEMENDDEISQQMTASYSEISFKSGLSPEVEAIGLSDLRQQRPATLACSKNGAGCRPFGPLDLEGTLHYEGNMTHFVAGDLEYKIKLSSPVTKKGETPPLQVGSRTCTPSPLYRQLLVPVVNPLDSCLINDLEREAQKLATSIDNLIENLSEILHSISSITADNVDVYKNAVSKMSDAMDSNIKSMYTMMAKVEEVTQVMKTVEAQALRVKEIKKLVDLLEGFM